MPTISSHDSKFLLLKVNFSEIMTEIFRPKYLLPEFRYNSCTCGSINNSDSMQNTVHIEHSPNVLVLLTLMYPLNTVKG